MRNANGQRCYNLLMLKPLKDLRAALDASGAPPTQVSEHALDLLSLAISSLEKLDLQALEPELLQVAVLGPTQAGKSTLVNLLVGSEVTTVSALAGHTRHARGAMSGLAAAAEAAVLQQIDLALEPAQRVAGDALDPADLAQYSLVTIGESALAALPGAGATNPARPHVVWDTPDFDSLAADSYRHAVLAVAGLADVLVLIVSRDKYGDMTVWELLDRLALLSRTGLFVVNKADPANWQELHDHLAATQVERLGDSGFEIHRILAVPGGSGVAADSVLARIAATQPVTAAQIRQGINALLTRGWADWLAPLQAEASATQAYRDALQQQRDQFMAAYRRDYLADAERYDTFQRLLGELLVLLEIPGLARTMGSVRRVVTWPVRQLFGARSKSDDLGREPELLAEGAEHLLLELRMQALEAGSKEPFWTRVATRLNAEQTARVEQFRAAAAVHHEQFQATVASAAQDLYTRLQETPALLNSLRAIRASADAAGVVVALQTGGIGLADLVLTPVMLSLTSTLTESAAKTYVDQVVADLQEQQYQAVAALLENELAAPLAAYTEAPDLLRFSSVDLAELEAARAGFVALEVAE